MPEARPRQGEEAVEKTDIHPQRVLLVAGIIVLTLVLVAAAVWGLLVLWRAPGAGPNQPRNFQPQAPRLEAAPQDERAAYVAEKEKRLHAYGWVDRQAGIAHVPIEVAMDMMANRKKAGGGDK